MTLLFESNDLPRHIDVVNSETARMFSAIRGNKELLFELLGLEENIDLVLAWNEFDRLTYNQIFKETQGDSELMFDMNTSRRVYERVKKPWQANYFMKYFVKRGIADVIETNGTEVYFFKKEFKEALKMVLRDYSPQRHE